MIARELANDELWEGCPEGTRHGAQTLLKILAGDEYVLDNVCAG